MNAQRSNMEGPSRVWTTDSKEKVKEKLGLKDDMDFGDFEVSMLVNHLHRKRTEPVISTNARTLINTNLR